MVESGPAAHPLDRLDGAGPVVVLDICDDHLGPLARKQIGGRPSNAVRTAGHDGNLTIECDYRSSSWVGKSAGMVISMTCQSSEYSSTSCLTPGAWYQASPSSTRISPMSSR